ncbi:RNA polymerase sigma-37 (RpsB/SigB) subunit [Scopulibacillus darangshiensis]|uniref:RNA polymerase sigma-37 (RpsB/SigB) subunit n=1 Tax=Scopulibacillus darangshiensis TaxID=442528 RepID=A0A4R2NQ88_9BACL|nr:RNA polymerase sigma factor SigB [Scopulibacillus darangshiensis]TCP23832.1 RNA polymerase sigma-37 (RpsB/SigB) subunit [Scopulibacillus darangshiensis]
MPIKSQLQQSDINDLIALYQKDPKDEAVQNRLINQYENLVISLSNKFSKSRDIQEDLFQVGMIGLLASFRRFDPSFGRSFESFAVPTIVGEIKRYIRDKTWSVHVPRRIKELGPKIKKAVDVLTNDLQRSPKVIEIADYLSVSEEDILETMEMGKSYNALSVDTKIEADSEGSTVTLLDLVGSQEQGYETVNKKLLLEKVFHVLSEREKQILECTYFENLSQKETGDRLGISQMHVSRLQRRALQKLRETLPDEGLEKLT